jgi:hypothetical protein
VKTKHFGGESGRSFSSKQTRNDKTHHEICKGKSFLLQDLE